MLQRACFTARRLAFLALAAGFVHFPQTGHAAAAESPARQLALQAADAMGGIDRLQALKAVRLKAVGHRYMREQSERPAGPWFLDYFQIDEIRDLQQNRLREERQSRGCDSTRCWQSAQWSNSITIVADGTAAEAHDGELQPASAARVQDAEERLAFAPERMLVLALAAPDLRLEPDVQLHGYEHHVLAFTSRGMPARIFVSSQSNVPVAVEWTRARPYDLYWSGWGDVTTRVTYGYWMLERGGLHYPRAWTAESNGQPDWTWMINELTLDPVVTDEQLSIPQSVRTQFAQQKLTLDEWALPTSPQAVMQLAPGVVQVAGAWNVAYVRQADGVVIIEAPISNGYSGHVLRDVQQRFPDLPIKAVISTSDAWPHIAGLREYVARDIPIYALDLNREILDRLLAAPHRLRADELAKTPRQARITYVRARSSIASATNRLELLPMRTLTGERMLAVYLPDQKLMYTSDLVQRSRDGTFPIVQALHEALQLQQRERVEVSKLFGMHIGPTDWQLISETVAAAYR